MNAKYITWLRNFSVTNNFQHMKTGLNSCVEY